MKPITERLATAAQQLVDARRDASRARAEAALAPWAVAWAYGLWAALLGLLEAHAVRNVARIRRELRDQADDISRRHRPGRAAAYRDAHRRKD